MVHAIILSPPLLAPGLTASPENILEKDIHFSTKFLSVPLLSSLLNKVTLDWLIHKVKIHRYKSVIQKDKERSWCFASVRKREVNLI